MDIVVLVSLMFRLIAGVVWGCVLLVPAASPQSAERYLQEAIALHEKGDFEGAIAGYRTYLKLRPSAIDARSNLGAALVHLGRYEEAIAEYKQALANHGSNPEVLLNLGLAYYKTGQFTDAARQFSGVRALQPENQQAVLVLADCRLRLGENKEVIALRRELAPRFETLHVDDEGEYWETSDAPLLAKHIEACNRALADELRKHPGAQGPVQIAAGRWVDIIA